MNESKSSDTLEKELTKQLAYLPKKKWQVWRIIVVGILTPILMPYFPMRRGSLAERMGYNDAVVMLTLFCIVLIPIGCYFHIQKVNDEISEIEWELEQLKKKKGNSDNDNQIHFEK